MDVEYFRSLLNQKMLFLMDSNSNNGQDLDNLNNGLVESIQHGIVGFNSDWSVLHGPCMSGFLFPYSLCSTVSSLKMAATLGQTLGSFCSGQIRIELVTSFDDSPAN